MSSAELILYHIIYSLCSVVGFITPTSGTAYVNGFDIQKDIASVRSSLGLCPQHDILFDSLTVEEHLKFFAKVSSVRKMNRLAGEATLSEMRNVLVCLFSRGLLSKARIFRRGLMCWEASRKS